MPRIRALKPDFFWDSDLCKLPPLVRIFFEGLWCYADRAGRLQDEPDKLKVQILPYEAITGEECLALLTPKFITRYSVGSKNYIQVNNFNKHQHPHKTETASRIPPPKSKLSTVKNNRYQTVKEQEEHGDTTVPKPLEPGGVGVGVGVKDFKNPVVPETTAQPVDKSPRKAPAKGAGVTARKAPRPKDPTFEKAVEIFREIFKSRQQKELDLPPKDVERLRRISDIHQPEGMLALWELWLEDGRVWSQRAKESYLPVIRFDRNTDSLPEELWKPLRQKYQEMLGVDAAKVIENIGLAKIEAGL